MKIKTTDLYVKHIKGAPPIKVTQLELIKDIGVKGDIFAVGGERQVSILLSQTINKIYAIKSKKACLNKFSCNMVLDGCELSQLKIGTIINFDNVILRITSIGRKCHEVCSLTSCPLINGIIFAEVVSGGTVTLNEEAHL